MKRFLCCFLFILAAFGGYGQSTLVPGDIAITGFNCDNEISESGFILVTITETENEFSFTILTDIESGTSIEFTDNGWRRNNRFRTQEGSLLWTADENLLCGTEVTISTGTFDIELFGNLILEDSPFYSVSTGSIDSTNGENFILGTNGDQIIAFQGTSDSPSFVYAINFNGTNWSSNSTNRNTSAIPTGLVNGITAVHINEIDNAEYDCTTSSSSLNVLADISNSSNWSTSNNTRFSPLGGCSYTCPTTSCNAYTTWNNGSWDNGAPTLTMGALIADDYNTSTNGSFTACWTIVNSGETLTVDNNSFIEVDNETQIDGNIIVETQGNFVQNNASGTFTVATGGNSSVNKTTPLKQEWYYYTYWSSPVIDETIENVYPDVPDGRRFWFNAANFVDLDGDDVDDDANDWQIASGSSTMTPGVGYAITSSKSGSFPRTDNITFQGSFNTGDINVPITFDPTNTGMRWNFIGNPYPSAIDFTEFHSVNSTVVEGVAYLWSQASPFDEANPGNSKFNFNENDYAMFTVGSGGVAGGGPDIPNGFIASGQGFFIPALSDATATFTNDMRVASTSSNSQFFKPSNIKKTESVEVDNKLWLNLTSDNGVFNQILVAYVDGATAGTDGMAYDAPKVLAPGFSAALYTLINGENVPYAIQGKSPSNLNEDERIQLGFITNITVPTLYEFSIAQLQGTFLESHDVFIEDNLLQKVHNLKNDNYTFTAEVGAFDDRFKIVFASNTLSNSDYTLNQTDVRILELSNDFVQFSTPPETVIKEISIFDLLGRLLYTFQGNSNIEAYQLLNIENAAYIARIELLDGQIITKKAIKN